MPMPESTHYIIQFLPDWMVGGVLKTASWAAAGSGVILSVIAETPVSLLATVVGGAVGIYIAHVNRSAVRLRNLEREAEKDRRIAVQDAEIAILKGRVMELSGSGVKIAPPPINIESPSNAPCGGTTPD